MPTYTMSCFQLPKTLCHDLENIMRSFWWGQKDKENNIAWVSWRKMCQSKLHGGMSFRNIQAFNLAILAKQGWRILTNPNSLVARVFKAKYFPYDDVLSLILILFFPTVSPTSPFFSFFLFFCWRDRLSYISNYTTVTLKPTQKKKKINK